MSQIFSSIACNLDTNILLASLPLFEQEKVEAIEWSFDTLFKYEEIPGWFNDLISEFSDQGRLVGHGVYFSLFSGKWLPEQEAWLKKLDTFSGRFKFDHITEHFGFMTGSDFHKGAPIGIPYTRTTLAIGIDRLQRIQHVCNCPVGLENLAFSYSLEEVKRHGEFLSKLVESVNGFIILDLHNLYCQMHNFGIDFNDIIALYPVEKVREIHISGGSWDERKTSKGEKIRRDTHDDCVPEEVFQLLKATIPKCPNLKFVVLEQMGTALDSPKSQLAFQRDFLKMYAIIKNTRYFFSENSANDFLPVDQIGLSPLPLENLLLFEQQQQLSAILETAQNFEHAQDLLTKSSLHNSEWNVKKWEPYMLETAMAIAQKWKNGF